MSTDAMEVLHTAGFRHADLATFDDLGDVLVPLYLEERGLRISVAWAGGRLVAFDDLCTCATPACPLSGGLLTGTTLRCSCHGSEFDITTGAVVRGPATRPLRQYEVRRIDDERSVVLFDGPPEDPHRRSAGGKPMRQSVLPVAAAAAVLAVAVLRLRNVRRRRRLPSPLG